MKNDLCEKPQIFRSQNFLNFSAINYVLFSGKFYSNFPINVIMTQWPQFSVKTFIRSKEIVKIISFNNLLMRMKLWKLFCANATSIEEIKGSHLLTLHVYLSVFKKKNFSMKQNQKRVSTLLNPNLMSRLVDPTA
jgi:hypothetical protein